MIKGRAREFSRDDLDGFKPFRIAQLIGFAGESIDADGVDTAVELEAR